MRAIEERWSNRAKFRITLAREVDEWVRFVTEVERGYSASIYDYMNDLAARDFIAEVEAACQSLPIEYVSAVADADRRMREATRQQSTSAGGSHVDDTSSWWWFRQPLRLTGELKTDFAPDVA